MKVQSVAMLTGYSLWMGVAIASAAPDSAATDRPERKSLTVLIDELADDAFKKREAASQQLWEMGESALGELKIAAEGKDPEKAFRARDLIRKIQLYITPGTDPRVIKLVERYARASPNEKMDLLGRMQTMRAWRQILTLYAVEKNPQVLSQYQTAVEVISVAAARECLAKNDAAGAQEFLEMAPSTASGLMSLAEFHRSQGSLEAELKRALKLKGAQAAAWQSALYRASGQLDLAKRAADDAGEIAISTMLAALAGDPLPWLIQSAEMGNRSGADRLVADLAQLRWETGELHSAKLGELVRNSGSRKRDERNASIAALLALGESAIAEEARAKVAPLEAFTYYDSLERWDDALKVLGLDPQSQDHSAWVRERFAKILSRDIEDEDGDRVASEDEELVTFATFLEERGMHEECAAAFTAPLEELLAKDEEAFAVFMRGFFGSGSRSGAPQFAKTFVANWAGDDEMRWDQILIAAFGENEVVNGLWQWFGDLDPKASRLERFEGLLALSHMGRDPKKLRMKWADLACKAVQADDARVDFDQAVLVGNLSGDSETAIRIYESLPEEKRLESGWRSHAIHLSAVGRWQEAADLVLDAISQLDKRKLAPLPELHASAAAFLRQVGKESDATEHDTKVDRYALGRDALAIAAAYGMGNDYKRADLWYERAAIQLVPTDEEQTVALEMHVEGLMHQSRWHEAASVSEILARIASSGDISVRPALFHSIRKYRFQSDLAKALADLKENRAAAIKRLAICHRSYPTDGGIADFFFPAVREAGLIKEHDAWFDISWRRMMEVVDRFPDADNSANTVAWLAARAERNVDEATALLERALQSRPEQSAYLDTMAELQFVKGNRERALQYSARAVNFEPEDAMIRRQHERFRRGNLPK